MRSTPTRLALLILALLVPIALVACGGGSSSTTSVDPQQVLNDTFNNNTKISSGNLNLSIAATAQGSQSGTFTASLDGPFQTDPNNSGALPQLDLNAKVSGSGAGQSINFEGGITATQDQAFVTYQGQAYEIPSATFQQFKQTFAAQAASTSGSSASASSFLKGLGVDPATWLTNLTSQGTADVEGTSTNHISGQADIGKIIADLAKVAQNVPGASSQSISPSQLQQAQQFVKNASVDVYSGVDDNLLRKLEVKLDIQPPASASSSGVSSLSLDFSISLSGVNETQTITAPTGAKPFSDLQQQLGGLGALGGALGATPGSTSTSGSTSATAPSAAYAKCIAQAQASGNSAAINACIAKLGG